MSDEQPTLPALELLFTLAAQTKAIRSIKETELGDRTLFDVVGGSFNGPRLSGTVQPTGGDWVIRTSTASRLDVRLLFETHDGISLLFQYAGRAFQSGPQVRLEVAGTFEAPKGAYEWLNTVQAFGQGAVSNDWVRYRFFRFK
jgi:Protein of unknown function (DUF3237)